MARVNYLPIVWLAPESTRQSRRLVRHRAQLVRRRRDVKQRIRGLLRENRLRCEHATAWTKAWIKWLEREAPLSASDRWIVDDHLAEIASLSQRITAVEARRWAELARGMLRRGKPKNVVVAAVANRWVRWLHHELQREPAA